MPLARSPRSARLSFPILAALLLALAAGPALAYTIYLKDGSKLIAAEKYKVRGDKAIVRLANGAETMLPLKEIDVERTDKGNELNLGTATVIEGGKTQDLERSTEAPARRSTLQDLIKQREAAPTSGPTTIAQTEKSRRPREEGGAAATSDVVGRSPLRNVALAETIRTFLFGRGISSVEVLQGPTAKRPLLVFSTGTEGQVFKALNASATALLHVRDKSPGDVDSFEVLCRAPDGGSAGRFTMIPPQAQDLVAGRIEMPAYYVKYVQF
jgi:hypothetical protein